MRSCPMRPSEIYGLLPGKASTLLTDRLITGNGSGLSLPRKSGSSQTIYALSLIGLVG